MSTTTTTTFSTLRRDTAATTVPIRAASPVAQHLSSPAQGPESGPTIRPYDPETDRDGVERVFREVYTPLYGFSGLTTIAFIVFCRAYLDFSPESCFVLSTLPSEQGQPSRILGYIVGTPSTQHFLAAFSADKGNCKSDIKAIPAAPRMEEMRDPELRVRCMDYFRQRNAWVSAIASAKVVEELVLPPTLKTLLERFPAHFHMAILPEAQRKGFGANLVGAFNDEMRLMDVGGVLAAMPVGNEGAEKLYTKCGFERLRSEDGGKEVGVVGGGEGEMEGKTYMVKKID